MRSYFIIGAKLLGIYMLYLSLLTALTAVTALTLLFLASSSDPFSTISMLSSSGSLLILLPASIILLFKTEEIATLLKFEPYDEEKPVPHRKVSFRPGIVLIGVYIFSTNIGNFLATVFIQLKEANLGRSPQGTYPHGLSFSKSLLTLSITIIVSIILVFGSETIDNIINGKKQP